jgi:AcrR family transcriptional regulator
MPTRAQYRRRPSQRSAATRRRILAAVRELLAEGVFHECTVEEVAERAGVSRATLYQHYSSRLDLVDGICETMAANPALRERVDLDDVDAALAETVACSMRFWGSEDPVIAQLYGVVAVDSAASEFVDRQGAARRGELERLARKLRRARRLRRGVGEKRALATLLVLTSYGTFRELRRAGLGEREITKQLQDNARTLLLPPDA